MKSAHAVKRVKVVSSPPQMCSGNCYWQNLVRVLRAEMTVLRRDLIKARVEKKTKFTPVVMKAAPASEDEHEPLRPIRSSFTVPGDDVEADLVDLIAARG